MFFAYSSRTSVLALALAACVPGPGGGDTDTTTTSGSTSGPAPGTEGMSSTDTPTGFTTASPATTATDGVSTGEPLTTTGSTGEPNTTTLGPGTTTETTGALACDLVELTTERAHVLGGAVEDCGVVDPWNNSAAEWQAARDCALAAAAAEQQFQLVTWRQGIDSSVGRGYAGTAARSFALEELHFDSLGSPIVSSRPCAGLAAVDGCTVAPGEACIECAAPGLPGTVCDIP